MTLTESVTPKIPTMLKPKLKDAQHIHNKIRRKTTKLHKTTNNANSKLTTITPAVNGPSFVQDTSTTFPLSQSTSAISRTTSPLKNCIRPWKINVTLGANRMKPSFHKWNNIMRIWRKSDKKNKKILMIIRLNSQKWKKNFTNKKN